MYQNLKVTKVTDKMTSTNKPYKALEVTDEQGTSHQVNIFSDFPDYANVIAESFVRGELKKNDKGYLNLYSETVQKGRGGNPAYKTQQIEKVMDKKNESIKGFQDSKEWSIMVTSSMNKAIDLAIAEIKDIKTLNTLENDILKWRTWIIEHWDVQTTDKKPF